MQRRGASGQPTKGQRTKRPKAYVSGADLQEQLDRRTRELDEALQQQTATSEVLSIIRRSPADAQPVFDAIVQSAARLCNAIFSVVYLYDNDRLRVAATKNFTAEATSQIYELQELKRPDRSTVGGRTVSDRAIVHVPDVLEDPEYSRDFALAGGWRAVLGVPLLRDGQAVGAITVGKREPTPFSDQQIQLLKTFADQAVIAIENVRLFEAEQARRRELSEALEQQTATSEVLKVISSSPGELEPVFEAMLANAVRICGAAFGNLWLREGDGFRIGATHGTPKAYTDYVRSQDIFHPDPRVGLGQVLRTKEPSQVADVAAAPTYGDKARQALIEFAGARTLIAVPMLKDNELVGAIGIYRQEVHPFTDKQIDLVKNFSAQAVIAIENARLLSELRESLQRQTATADVLKVISTSPGELEPVFQAMLENATRICDAKFGIMWGFKDNTFRGLSWLGITPEFADYVQQPRVWGAETGLGQLARTKQTVHVTDTRAGRAYTDRDPNRVAAIDVGGVRTFVAVPMLKDGELIGAVGIFRQEVRPFTDKQIELVTNFAAQAVIAIENARLLSELRQSLQQQTATADVLKVISRSTFDLQTVLDTLVESAARLCEADIANIWRPHGSGYRLAATHETVKTTQKTYLQNLSLEPDRGSCVGRVLLEGRIIHIHDIQDDPDYSLETSRLEGSRTMLGVPLLREGTPVGVIALSTRRPFTEQQIELVKTFADQAVIAIENVRLFDEVQARTRELSESLEQQTATSEVLKVIASSSGELQQVFDTMLANATRLCGASYGAMWLRDGDGFRNAALHGPLPPEYVAQISGILVRPGPDGALTHVVQTRKPVHVPDLRESRAYLDRDTLPVAAVEVAGVRTIVSVPMFKADEVIGAITIYRKEIRPFTDKQIELVSNFAAQAVIAIENTRLLGELRESLQQQTATADVLKVISSSTGELEPVFQAMLGNAVRICGAKFGNLWLREGDAYRIGATHGAPSAYVEFLRTEQVFVPKPGIGLGQLAKTKEVYHLADVAAAKSYGDRLREATINLAGARTLVVVPMLKDDEVIGAVAIYRQEVRPFTDKQIELVKNFAAQAVIAIENTRLLNELRESLQQQTATADVLKTISRSTFDLQTVLDTLTASAARLCDADFAFIFQRFGDLFHLAATHGFSGDFIEYQKQNPIPLGRGSLTGRTALERKMVHIPDVLQDPEYTWTKSIELAQYRTMLGIPLLREGVPIGVIALLRRTVRPFTDKQIELVTTFADQAVIAIENVRLFDEVQARTRELSESLEQQTATSEVLKVISSSPGELEPVFDAMLTNATRICEARFGTLYLRDGDGLRAVGATRDAPPTYVEARKRELRIHPSPDGVLGRAAITKQVVHIADIRCLRSYLEHDPFAVAAVELGKFRTALGVPMLKDDELIGVITIMRQEVRPFADKQIELVQNFAAQAVIAIENARLLNELRTRTSELAQSVSELQALGEVSQAVNSTLELETVLTTIVGRAVELSHTDTGAIYVFDEERKEFRLHATYGMSEAMIVAISGQHIGLGDGNVGLATTQRRPVQVPDIRDEPGSPVNEIILREGYRSILVIPLLRPDHIVGALVVRRKTPGEFPQSTINLLQTFADQSVVAIQNARLYENVETRTRELAKSLDDLRTTQDRLVQTQKLASLGQLTAGIAHEIKNPLNFVNNFSGVSVELIDELRQALAGANLDSKLRAEISEIADTLQGNLDKVVQHGKRADAIVKNMLVHSREGSGEHRLVDVNAIVEESLNLAYHGARAEKQGFNITMECSLDPAAGEVDVFPQDITRALLNLISNGFYAATKRSAEGNGGDYEPTLVAATRNLGDRVEIRIRDNGTGIPLEVKEKIFNPFFTTKPAGEGTGLGLSISHDIIVKQHGGSIEVDTQPGEFTEFTIILPRERDRFSEHQV
jgi:GAF domain-containing protein